MCTTCGCGADTTARVHDLQTGERAALLRVLDPPSTGPLAPPRAQVDGHHHGHSHDHGHAHDHSLDHGHDHSHHHGAPQADTELIQLETRVLATNDRIAVRNRGWFDQRGVVALNLMSSPGSGKTTLLVRSLEALDGPVGVLEGDQETSHDAERVRATGAPVVQVNTGTGCHLEAEMVWQGLQRLDPPGGAVVFIENVGNLVCPALFDLGEDARVVLFSVTEGEDKPEKYPHIFRTADLVLLTKVDLLPYLDFDVERSLTAIRSVNPAAPVLQLSARSGQGMQAWLDWIAARRRAVAADPPGRATLETP